jgi:hypothetical protein
LVTRRFCNLLCCWRNVIFMVMITLF